MDSKLVAKSPLRTAIALMGCSSFIALAVACQNSDAQVSKDVPTVLHATEPTPADNQKTQKHTNDSPAPKAAGQPSYKEAAFQLTLSPPDSVPAGQPLVFKVILEALGEYKVNEEYPIKFQFEEQEGTKPKKMTVLREEAKIEKQRAEVPLSVTFESAGKRKVSGKLSFSVCTDERCLIEKRDLAVEVDAS